MRGANDVTVWETHIDVGLVVGCRKSNIGMEEVTSGSGVND